MSQHRYAAALFIVALATLPTVLVWPREFTNWDDQLFVTDNVAVQYPTPTNLAYLSTHPVAGNVIPVTMLAYVIDWQIHRTSAWGYALTNALLYAACCLLLGRILVRARMPADVARLATVLFAVHPAHVENVSWISGRKDLVCVALLFGSFLAFLQDRAGEGRRSRVLSIVLLVLAGLAKPLAMSAAPALLLYDVLVLRRRLAESLRALWPHVLICVGIVALAFWSQAEGDALKDAADVRSASLDRAGATLVIDAWRCFVPTPFSPFYPQSVVDDIPAPLRWGALILAVGGSLGVLRAAAKRPAWRMPAWLWWLALLFLVPVSGLVPLGATSLADRYLLVPSIASCVLVAWGVHACPRVTVMPAAYGLALVLAVLFHLRAFAWSNSVRMWETASERYPAAVIPWKNLTRAHFERGHVEQAVDAALLGLEHRPEDISLVGNATELLIVTGRLDEAAAVIDRAESLGAAPDELEVLRAKLDLRSGNAAAAAERLRAVLSEDPGRADAWHSLSYALQQLDDPTAAIEAAQTAVNHDQAVAEYHRRLISLLQAGDNLPETERAAAAANRALPHFAEAWEIRISVLRRLGRDGEADRVEAQANRFVPLRGGLTRGSEFEPLGAP